LSQLFLYAFFVDWHGQWCWGTRYLTEVTPMVALMVLPVLSSALHRWGFPIRFQGHGKRLQQKGSSTQSLTLPLWHSRSFNHENIAGLASNCKSQPIQTCRLFAGNFAETG
ncbi:MAG TPA: hypothetical protein PKW73_07010, partial [Candidatus Obscuribacter sp.]|nr:hypothetical protein [Candidatus Obscuribacter sp.]